MTARLWQPDNEAGPNNLWKTTLQGELLSCDENGAIVQVHMDDAVSVKIINSGTHSTGLSVKNGDKLHAIFRKPGLGFEPQGWPMVFPFLMKSDFLVTFAIKNSLKFSIELDVDGQYSLLYVRRPENITFDHILLPINVGDLPPASLEKGAWESVTWDKFTYWRQRLENGNKWLPYRAHTINDKNTQYRCIGGITAAEGFQTDVKKIETMLVEEKIYADNSESIKEWITALSTSYFVLAEIDSYNNPVAYKKISAGSLLLFYNYINRSFGQCALAAIQIIPASNALQVSPLSTVYEQKASVNIKTLGVREANQYNMGGLIGRMVFTPLTIVGDAASIAGGITLFPVIIIMAVGSGGSK